MGTDAEERTSEEAMTTLGPCHYGGEDDEATMMAVRADGTGWISICDEHKKDAKKDGFEPET
jgi:hypothetical protein